MTYYKIIPMSNTEKLYDVSEYNTGEDIPPTQCCGKSVDFTSTRIEANLTNLVTSCRYVFLMEWQCLVNEHHNGKSIFLMDGFVLETGTLDLGVI